MSERDELIRRLEAAMDRMEHAPSEEVDSDEYKSILAELVRLRKERGDETSPTTGPCKHEDFECFVDVNRLEDIGRFQADLRIMCSQCETVFRFIGLSAGVDLNGAAASIDGTEVHLAIAPKGEVLTPLDDTICTGFTVRKTK